MTESDIVAFFEDRTSDGPLENLFQQFSQGVLIADDNGKILKINQAFELLSQYTANELFHKNLEDYAFGLPKNEHISRAGKWKGEIPFTRKSEESIHLWLEVLSYQSQGKKHYRLYLFRELHPLAYKDPLTNLPNRRCFLQCIDKIIKQKQFRDGFTIMYLDLDHFKKINDTLGHRYGDELLVEAAKRIRASIRKKDVVARLGGDEFICLLTNLIDKKVAESIAVRIIDAFSKPFYLLNQEVYISVTIGLSLYPFDGETFEALITNADMAMYQAKRLGKNQWRWFQAEHQASQFETFILENHLRKAIQNNEFTLHYQPLLSLKNRKISSVEALIRWNHPEYGQIPPNDFIPIAEDTGMIIPIGNWVLLEACKQKRKWTAQGFSSVKIAVNVSPSQFLRRDFPATVKDIIKKTSMDPKQLIIEITENAIIQDFEVATENLNQLKTLGICISIDDFGTGYSSLHYLSKLPIDYLKIDRSFICDIETNQKNKVLTKAMISLAHALELGVVAEGIENDSQMDEVTNMDCDVLQGYLISKPLEPTQVCDFFCNKKGE
ncbi:sensor domain-containing protein [Bacillus marasmi]|uniref:sensor domain-containing protein n=1 Tax=Bacillus marasmi TaxID=1926279 RepID=UPI0011C7EB2B|nr:EAL domain-containing protein [Bacillus marasmi]